MRNLAAFINFGCEPNCESKSIPALSGDRRLPRIGILPEPHTAQCPPLPAPSVRGAPLRPRCAGCGAGIYAKKDILVGTELTYLRDTSAVGRREWSGLECRCGAANCRGYL